MPETIDQLLLDPSLRSASAQGDSPKDGSIIIGLVPKDSPWGAFYEEKKRAGHPFYRNARFYTLKEIENMLQTPGLKISSIRSTLLKRPDDSRKIEEPVEGNISGAGFLCIEVNPVREQVL